MGARVKQGRVTSRLPLLIGVGVASLALIAVIASILSGSAFAWPESDKTLAERASSGAFGDQMMALYELGNRGRDAQSSANILIEIVKKDSDEYVKSAAVIALGKIG